MNFLPGLLRPLENEALLDVFALKIGEHSWDARDEAPAEGFDRCLECHRQREKGLVDRGILRDDIAGFRRAEFPQNLCNHLRSLLRWGDSLTPTRV